MPIVDGVKYPYTAQGLKQAKAHRKKLEQEKAKPKKKSKKAVKE